MTQATSQPHVPPELQQEFEAQTYALLRSRFLWFSGILTGLGAFTLLSGLVLRFAAPSLLWLIARVPPNAEKERDWWPIMLATIVGLLAVGTYATCFFVARTKHLQRERFLQLTYLLVVCDGLLHTGAAYVPGGSTVSLGIWGFAFTHFLACCFLPWTIKQALQPLLPVLGVWIILKLTLSGDAFASRMAQAMMGTTLFLPALALVYWRHTRRAEVFERQFLYRRYRDVRRELYDARRIHEALFPRPQSSGPIRVNYRYEPMQQIGGDYFFTFQTGGAVPTQSGIFTPGQSASYVVKPVSLSVVLLDVTGHGILAALTVNRIYGELCRIFAENPDVTPAEVLRSLNRYAHLTLAPHSVYVTAMCARVDTATDSLLYANGGHPPAYLRRADGTVEELIATTFLLGPCPDAEYDPGSLKVPMHPGDALIAYTDGVIEARGVSGKEWGLRGIRDAVTHKCDVGAWADKLVADVEKHRLGPAADDTLVVEVWRPRADATQHRSGDSTRRKLEGTGKFAAVAG